MVCWIVLEEVEEVEDEEVTTLNLEKMHHPHIFLDGLMHQWVQTKVVKTCVDALDDCLWGWRWRAWKELGKRDILREDRMGVLRRWLGRNVLHKYVLVSWLFPTRIT